MKTTTHFSFIALSAAIAFAFLRPFSVQAQPAPVTTTNVTDAAGVKLEKLVQALNNYSPLNEIAELTRAGVDDSVILTYIQNSATSYNVSAQDIVKLREQGVSPAVTTALIQRGTEVRPVTTETASPSQATDVAAAPVNQSPPVVVAVPAPASVIYVPTLVRPVSTVSVTYFGTSSYRCLPAGYPQYVTFGSGYGCSPRGAYGVGYGVYRLGGYRSGVRLYR